REIVFAANEDTITIVDVENKNNPRQIGRRGYAGSGYTHQGWLTEDQQYFVFNDEFDEFQFGHNTRTHVMDVRNLDNPRYVGFYEHSTSSTDHNLYIKDDYVFEANYGAGLQILKIDDVGSADFSRAGFYDTSQAWSVYPYFDNGKVIVSDINDGLYVLQFDLLVNDVDADFNDDGLYNCADINALTAEIAAGSNNDDFDLTGDGVVNLDDQTQWLTDAGGRNLSPGSTYLPGDANLDGAVDVSDFNIWNREKFTNNTDWCAANFNGDDRVDVGDFNIWNANKFQSADAAPASVPEPGTLAMLIPLLWVLVVVRRR
ncbi:MAG: choice-of-anchor B family protein, partial [Planctomycetota bacterium]